MQSQSNTKPFVMAQLPMRVRIAGRRLQLGWFALPEWLQVVSVALLIGAWLYAAVVILFA